MTLQESKVSVYVNMPYPARYKSLTSLTNCITLHFLDISLDGVVPLSLLNLQSVRHPSVQLAGAQHGKAVSQNAWKRLIIVIIIHSTLKLFSDWPNAYM